MKNLSKAMRLVVSAGALLAFGATAQAGITDPALVITASNANGTGVFQVFLSNGTFSTTNTLNDTWEWSAPIGGYDIFDDNFNLVSHVDTMYCKMVADPQISLNFSVNSTSLATHFSIVSGVLSFGTINPAIGRATAGITITDNDGDGSALAGDWGGKAYHADFNSGSTFANLVSDFAGPADDSAVNSESTAGYPGYLGMGSVSDISSRFDFTLSANDSASGTSFYEVIPSPGAAALLAFAGIAGMGRRRR